MKTCNICGETKAEDKFAKNRNQCKLCRSRQAKKHKKKCAHCGAFFLGEKNATFCSIECRSAAKVKRETVPCSYCGKGVEIKEHQKKFSNHYCDKACQGKHRSSLLSGENSPRYSRVELKCIGCGSIFEVIPYYKNTRKYCSSTCAQNHMVGERHPRYNDNLTDEQRISERDYPEYNHWRKTVFERDRFTCIKCSDCTGGNLVAHHIYNFSEHEGLRTDVCNGVTLCEKCHIDFHKSYGYTRNNIDQLLEFMEDKLIPSEVVEKLTERVETNQVV
ncbi:hypothetical protein CHH52_13385 [Shouchella clausii]|nr:hypothetical protein CHH52_13385 [Shouchella clausii]